MPLLILVRDGRNVVASNARSFDLNEESIRQDWASAGAPSSRRRAEPRRRAALPDRSLRRPGREARADDDGDLAHVWSRPRSLRLRRGAAFPVRGSSAVRDAGAGVHWVPVEKDDAFRPNERWRDWAPYQHARFAEVAGDVQRAFGYPLEPTVTSDRDGAAARSRRRHHVDAAQAPAPAPAAALVTSHLRRSIGRRA